MSVISIDTDIEAHTLTLVAQFDAEVESVWQLWADPRKLERWWGPPTHPATFVEHSLVEHGRAEYFMTGPDGERFNGYWTINAANPPHSLSFVDGFADDDGAPVDAMPTTTAVLELQAHAGGTQMTLISTARSKDDLVKLIEMGMVEGLRAAAGQMDAVLLAV
ncbi:MAG: SRPBCC domain-containing protein [Actinomycetes bacterium]